MTKIAYGWRPIQGDPSPPELPEAEPVVLRVREGDGAEEGVAFGGEAAVREHHGRGPGAERQGGDLVAQRARVSLGCGEASDRLTARSDEHRGALGLVVVEGPDLGAVPSRRCPACRPIRTS